MSKVLANYIGIDEVGRGSWAGPLLVVAARCISKLPDGLTDSKQLSRKQRQSLLPFIISSCTLGEGWVSAVEIDRVGLASAMRLGVQRALENLHADYDDPIIMDGPVNYCPDNFSEVTCIIGADASQPIVSAASIYAKELRDAYMAAQDKKFPGYGFAQNVGYGTKVHLAALQNLGICQLHRVSYKPIKLLAD